MIQSAPGKQLPCLEKCGRGETAIYGTRFTARRRRYAGFLVVFCVTVLALWLFGAELFSLFRIVRHRPDAPFGWVARCIAGFLFLSGISAFFGLLNIWFHGPVVIWLLVLTHLGSALLAIATLLILRALVPRILEIPTHAQWLTLNKDLLHAEARAEEKEKLLATVSHELRTPRAPLVVSLTELEDRIA